MSRSRSICEAIRERPDDRKSLSGHRPSLMIDRVSALDIAILRHTHDVRLRNSKPTCMRRKYRPTSDTAGYSPVLCVPYIYLLTYLLDGTDNKYGNLDTPCSALELVF